ncbi:hypothetical protein KP509_12G007000 [Ceratopteris richardii]|uniref:DNA (cytosine-5-)-methyltransferase n=1 Tax=Ceratopteris richardii TaxID=49495 RepID=A0A8T2TIU1_CERRI|nr:hypothetical protein KP509_12G007000 [Ceratopteris richardii]
MPARKVIAVESSSEGEEDLVEFKQSNKKRKLEATQSTADGKTKGATPKHELSGKKTKNGTPSKRAKGSFKACFSGPRIPKDEAMQRWPERYSIKKSKNKPEDDNDKKLRQSPNDEDAEESGPSKCVAHYSRAEVDGTIYELGNCVHVHSGGEQNFIARIVEFFEDDKRKSWFTAQWFYRVEDTAIKVVDDVKNDKKRVFYSEVRDFNALDCLDSKIKIVRLSPLHHFNTLTPKPLPPCDYYYDMGYDISYSRFYALPPEVDTGSDGSDITNCNEMSSGPASSSQSEIRSDNNEATSGVLKEYTLLDLYSGCGGMSTGLCMGAMLSSVKLVARWALDLNPNACKSLEYNHPETKVRNESAEDFLMLLKEWRKLCEKYVEREDVDDSKARKRRKSVTADPDDEADTTSAKTEPGEFEVEKIIGIRYSSETDSGKAGIEMKVRWKGYGPSDDTWEPLENLGTCDDCVRKFVVEGKKNKILPLPGDVDVVCGGPPCQGASGFNRFRNRENPLQCERNRQIIVYMDIVDYLKPRFVLMENVVDILRFANGILGRYALARLVKMHYQAQLGMMVAGCYGLPQFRMRVFIWGAAPRETLPPYPMPTHDVVPKGGIPQEWERNMVAYDEDKKPTLLRALNLGDALRDLPPVKNSETRDEISYGGGAQTEFQRFIRLPKDVLTGVCSLASCKKQKMMLYDHRPLNLNTDDYQRVCRIPHQKGANFRNLPGLIIKDDNTVALDETVERELLPSGKPLVPDYAITFVKGKSLKPFGRLWWDETVPTVVTRAEPHNQALLHPVQDRVLTIRENARLQGFPDYYKLFGPVKERYVQVGNAVAVPVGRVLGYSLGLAIRHAVGSSPTMELPAKFPQSQMKSSAQQISDIPLEPLDDEAGDD